VPNYYEVQKNHFKAGCVSDEMIVFDEFAKWASTGSLKKGTFICLQHSIYRLKCAIRLFVKFIS